MYCDTIQTSCKGFNQQYTSVAQCLAVCDLMDAGAPGSVGGDSVACRSYHATVAAGDPGLHCPHAGPSGDGVCGDVCDGYCRMALAFCPSVYFDQSTCKTDCVQHGSSTRYNTTEQSGPTAACLVYWAADAALDSNSCNDLDGTSGSCVF